MAIGHLTQQESPQGQILLDRLVQEWRQPQNAAEPILIEQDSSRFGDSIHLYVIWTDWGALSQRERSHIVLSAYQQTHSPEKLLDVTVAMGLTPDEAERIGIRYTTE